MYGMNKIPSPLVKGLGSNSLSTENHAKGRFPLKWTLHGPELVEPQLRYSTPDRKPK